MKNNSKQNNGFVMLPRWLFESKQLTGKEKLFCMILAYHRNDHTKLCCPKRLTLCKEAGFSEHTYYKIRDKLQKIGLISYESGSGGRKHSIKYKLNWLDGSKQEIEKLKRILRAKKPLQKSTALTSAKEHSLTCAKMQKKPLQKSTGNYKEYYNNKEYQQQQEEVAAAEGDFSFSKLKEKTLKKLREYGLSDKKIEYLAVKAPTSNPNEYFAQCIEYIESPDTKRITNPAGFIIRLVERSEPAPYFSKKPIPPYLKGLEDFSGEEEGQEEEYIPLEYGEEYAPPAPPEKVKEYAKKIEDILGNSREFYNVNNRNFWRGTMIEERFDAKN